jgi:putative PIN family toxin of toxin-antitoxin system
MIALRLVIDTNMVVSAALKPDGLQRTVLLLAITKPARLYVSDAIMDEYREVLARRRMGINKGRRRQLLQLIRNRSQTLTPARQLQVTPDPEDNKFLECADAARGDYLVTGNQRHFPKYWKKTKVITSREFISICGAPPDSAAFQVFIYCRRIY